MTLAQRLAVAVGAIGILISSPTYAAVALANAPSINTSVPGSSTVTAEAIPIAAGEWTTNDTVDTIGFGLLVALGGSALITQRQNTHRSVREQLRQSVSDGLNTVVGNVEFVVLFSRTEKISTAARDTATSEAVKVLAGLETQAKDQKSAELLSNFRSIVYRLLTGSFDKEDETKLLKSLRETAGNLSQAMLKSQAAS